jgi:hypothetical protein
MLTDKTIARLDIHLMTMRIIHAALAMGVLVFAIVALAAGRLEMKPAGEPIDWIMAGFGAATGIAGWIVPRLIPLPNPSAGSLNETAQALSIAGGTQTALIIGCAIFEGGAFANLVRYYTDHISLNLAVAGVLWLFLLLQFPRRGALLDRVERRLRELREEQALTAGRR